MFQIIRNWLDRRTIGRSTITPSQWSAAFAALPLLDGLVEDEKRRLRELAILFLDRKAIEGAHELAVTQSMALIIALQACLPILELGLACYDGWSTVIVYPSGFAPERVVTDEYGVEHRVRDELAGEAWQRGPVILAWDETEHAGYVDGFPPLHREMNPVAWTHAFSAGFEDFQQRCRIGEHIGISCYGASSPAEYFAVLSEVFFERPDLLRKYYAAVYEQMRQFYRQDP